MHQAIINLRYYSSTAGVVVCMCRCVVTCARGRSRAARIVLLLHVYDKLSGDRYRLNNVAQNSLLARVAVAVAVVNGAWCIAVQEHDLNTYRAFV